MHNKGRFKYEKLAKYPHMPPEDVLTWEIFLERYPNEYDLVDYDFHLGLMPELEEQAKLMNIGGAERVNQYKIDVIGYKNDRIDIIEVKGKAVPAAIGQLAMYKNLYDKEMKPTIQTYPVMIARSAAPYMPQCCKDHGILLIVLE